MSSPDLTRRDVSITVTNEHGTHVHAGWYARLPEWVADGPRWLVQFPHGGGPRVVDRVPEPLHYSPPAPTPSAQTLWLEELARVMADDATPALFGEVA